MKVDSPSVLPKWVRVCIRLIHARVYKPARAFDGHFADRFCLTGSYHALSICPHANQRGDEPATGSVHMILGEERRQKKIIETRLQSSNAMGHVRRGLKAPTWKLQLGQTPSAFHFLATCPYYREVQKNNRLEATRKPQGSLSEKHMLPQAPVSALWQGK